MRLLTLAACVSLIFAVKRPVTGGSTSSSAESGEEIAQGEGIVYECSPESNYDETITANVQYEINCTAFTDETVGLISEGSDWCTFTIEDPEVEDYGRSNCTHFCSIAGLTCIDAFNSTQNSCDAAEYAMTCNQNHNHAHGCVCWDADGDFVAYWDLSDRDFLPMLIFVLVFPFFFFAISGMAYYKAESLEDQLEAPKDKKKAGNRGSMSDELK